MVGSVLPCKAVLADRPEQRGDLATITPLELNYDRLGHKRKHRWTNDANSFACRLLSGCPHGTLPDTRHLTWKFAA